MTNGNNEVERQFNRVVDALGALFSGKRLVRDDIPHTEACDRFSLEFSRQRFAEVNVAMHDLGVAIRQTHAHEPLERRPEETGWLIELAIKGIPHWLMVSSDREWTTDSNDALRFAREQDAEAMLYHSGLEGAKATGHTWCDPLPNKGAQETGLCPHGMPRAMSECLPCVGANALEAARRATIPVTPSEAASFAKTLARSPRRIGAGIPPDGAPSMPEGASRDASSTSAGLYSWCTGEPHNCPYIYCHSQLKCAKEPATRTGPTDLVGALQDVVHTDPGPVRAGKSVRSEPLKGEPFPLRSALETLLQRYVTLVNCGDCGSWNPEEEDAVIQARAALQVGTVTAQSLPEHCGQTICWMPCERHKGGTFMMTIQSGSPAIAKCPGCETERAQR